MIKVLGELVKEGELGKLEIINIVQYPDVAAEYGVRSVPWLKLGDMEFSGAMSRSDIMQWIQLAEGHGDTQAALIKQLKSGALDDVVSMAHKQPSVLPDLLNILTGKDVALTVRIGISAVVESFQEQPDQLAALVPEISSLIKHTDPATRADGCHFLGLTRSEQARPWLEVCLDDNDQMVREMAAESLAELSGT